MWTLRIEHRVADFAAWKAAFDSDPVGRARGGVRRHRVLRGRDDPNHVAIDLEFDDPDQAGAFLEQLTVLWERVEREGLIEGPRGELYEEVETQTPAA